MLHEFMTEPIEPHSIPGLGARLTVTINDIAFGGEGVARVEDFVIFVPFTLVGESVEIEITGLKKRFARGRLLNVIQPSPDRVLAPCPHFGACGGCQYQQVEYRAQLRLKRKQVSDLLQRIGGFPGTVVQPVVPCPRPYGYRNRIMVRSQWDKFKQGLNIGFIRYDNRLVEDIEECRIAEPALNAQLRNTRANPPPKGGLKVVLRVNPQGWEVPPDAFFQNNSFLLPRLVETVRDSLRDSGVRHLVDAYCGVGFFAVELAAEVSWFTGIELNLPAIQAARRNAALRRAGNGEFVCGDVARVLPELLPRFSPALTGVIFDPPRAGCPPEALRRVRETRPAQVIYVSCHPATLARDLNALCRDGVYQLVQLVPLDMFPQTQHIECVADLRAVPAAIR
jgi:23S rRNA (uracil1939-C5)-methyltransferase